MRTVALVFVLLTTTATAFAQETPKPDYSPTAVRRVILESEVSPDDDKGVEYGFGTISFKALGTRWRYVYLPIMAPMAGTAFTTSKQMPDAFSLLGTPIAETPRTRQDRREMNAERRRIERMKVTVSRE